MAHQQARPNRRLSSPPIHPCPVDYSPVGEDLICKLHGQLERCSKCKQIKHPTTGACTCTYKPAPPPKPKPAPKPRNRPGPKPKPVKPCIFCGTPSRRKYCDDHRKLYQTVRYWKLTRGISEEEAVDLVVRGENGEKKVCSKCGRPIAYKSASEICRKCTIRAHPPKGKCRACEGPTYSEKGYFCKEVLCTRLSLRFSYYRRCGKTDEQIFQILEEPIQRLRRGEDP